MSANPIFVALKKRVAFEVVSSSESVNQLRIMGRIPDDLAKLNSNNWKIVKYRLLKAMEERPWKVDLSKSYFIKKETGKMVFAWRILVQGEGVAAHYADVANLITTSPSARSDVMEIPLGAGADRNNPAGGRRGVAPTGTVNPGAGMLMQKKMGA